MHQGLFVSHSLRPQEIRFSDKIIAGWAGGATTYAGGPYTMQVKSVLATDYSTGTQYTYGDTSGSWQSIKSSGGTINSSGSSADASAAVSAPAVTAVSNGAPLPFSGTHRDSTSTYTTPNVYPWVTSVSAVQSASTPVTTIPGLPSGWTVNSSGKVVAPSAAPVSEPPSGSPDSCKASSLMQFSSVNIPSHAIYLVCGSFIVGLLLGGWGWL